MKNYKVYYTCTNNVLKKYRLPPIQLTALFRANDEEDATELASEILKRVRQPGGGYRELVSIDKIEEYNGSSVLDLMTEEEIEKLDNEELEEGINERGIMHRKLH